MKKTYRYKNIFMYASLQFCGHMDTYFIQNTETLVVYVINPRLKSKHNVVRLYKRGSLIRERKVWSSDNLLLYYGSWYFHQLVFLFTYFRMDDTVVLLSMHPLAFFGMRVLTVFRNITYIYWIGDYFPPTKLSLRLFEKLKQYYHNKVDFRYYLSDKINSIFNNGTVLNNQYHKTAMWGVKAMRINHSIPGKEIRLLFVGLIKEGQELELIFSLLKKHRTIHLNIIGICPDHLYKTYKEIIRAYAIEKQVFFPNMFYNDKELLKVARTCHIGIALYDPSPFSSAFYTDPGKVKAYTEFRLPVIMSDTSEISRYIKKCHAGEIIRLDQEELLSAIQKIRNNYRHYLMGIDSFNREFYYNTYYQHLFSFHDNQ